MIPLQTASRHPVSHILFSPDGSAVAVAQPHYGVTLLERATGRTLAVCEMPRRALLKDFAFCGDGRFFAAAHAKGLEVFDTATGAPVYRNFHYPQAFQLATRGDALLGAAPKNYTALRPLLKVGDTIASPELTKSVLYRRDLAFVSCAPDGSHVLSVDGNRFVLLNVASNQTAAEFEHLAASQAPADRVARFCPLGRRFAINDGWTIDAFDAGELADEGENEQQADPPLVQRANGTQIAVASAIPASRASLAGQSQLDAGMPHVGLAPVFSLKPDKPADAGRWYPPFALAADGRGLLVKRPRNRVQLWDAPTGALVNEWSWRFEWVTCVAVSADGLTAVAGGRFGRVILWDLE
jgi:hypothetical protein